MAPAQSPAWRKQYRGQFKKTKLCRFNLAGHCNFGKDCLFAHGPEDLQLPPDLTKTALCEKWQEGHCPYGARCPFAHGQDELRVTHAFEKAKLSNRTGKRQDDIPEGDDEDSEQGSTHCGSSYLETASMRSNESPRVLPSRRHSSDNWLNAPVPPVQLNLDDVVQAPPVPVRNENWMPQRRPRAATDSLEAACLRNIHRGLEDVSFRPAPTLLQLQRRPPPPPPPMGPWPDAAAHCLMESDLAKMLARPQRAPAREAPNTGFCPPPGLETVASRAQQPMRQRAATDAGPAYVFPAELHTEGRLITL